MTVKQVIKSPGFYFYYLFLVVGLPAILFLDKGDIVLYINEHFTPYFDILFKYWTHFGDGIAFALLVIYFLFRNYYFALISGIAIVIQTVIVQGLKRIVFYGMPRPRLFFPDFDNFHVVEGVTIVGPHTFPSGHTATAFTMAVMLSLFVKDKRWSLLFVGMAVLVGISRIYLLQHFFIDVYAGSLIGVIVSLGVSVFFERKGFQYRKPWNTALVKRK